MTELYRGLLEIFVMRCIEQIESLRSHIRSSNSGVGNDPNFDIGVTGFWNLMLETIFTIFTIVFLMMAVCLVAILAVTSYLPAALINYVGWVFRNVRNPVNDSPVIIKQHNDQEKK